MPLCYCPLLNNIAKLKFKGIINKFLSSHHFVFYSKVNSLGKGCLRHYVDLQLNIGRVGRVQANSYKPFVLCVAVASCWVISLSCARLFAVQYSILYCTVLYSLLHSTLFFTVQYSILYCTVLYSYRTVLYSLPYSTLFFTVQYFTLCCTVLYSLPYSTLLFIVQYSTLIVQYSTLYRKVLDSLPYSTILFTIQ